ncbi:MAG TPA: hypothetical protein VMB05_03170 [Solirubrobacteraceae bacterium]|nr:hypothetical protein [Solirubrobacteraceae bacterium]
MSTIPNHPKPWELVNGRSLSDLLDISAHSTSGGCRWRRARCELSEAERLAAAAWLVAQEIMRLRCYRATEIFDFWYAAATETSIPEGGDPALAEPFIRPSFGSPPDGGAIDHVQGYIAEVTWRMLVEEETTSERTIVYLAHPDPDVTALGADGFVVYRPRGADVLVYRLWEIKKRDGGNGVSGTIGVAYDQLTKNADRYLAKLTAQCDIDESNELLDDLFAELVPIWKRADPAAGVGVAVATDAAGLPTTAFTTMHTHFPRLADAGGIEGCLVGLGSLRDFSLYVRALLWSGLSAATI